jgi:hypothetical protein
MLTSTKFPGLLGKALYQNAMPHELDVGHTDEGLPETGGPGILRDSEVTLETHFTRQWGEDFARLGAVTWERLSREEDLKEDLRVAVLYISTFIVVAGFK